MKLSIVEPGQNLEVWPRGNTSCYMRKYKVGVLHSGEELELDLTITGNSECRLSASGRRGTSDEAMPKSLGEAYSYPSPCIRGIFFGGGVYGVVMPNVISSPVPHPTLWRGLM